MEGGVLCGTGDLRTWELGATGNWLDLGQERARYRDSVAERGTVPWYMHEVLRD